MVKRIIKQEVKDQIWSLHKQGIESEKIVTIVGWDHKTAKRSVNDIILKFRKAEEAFVKSGKKPDGQPDLLLDEMTRDERYKHIKKTLTTTPRCRLTFQALNEDEKSMFLDEYYNVIKSTDTLTEVEEQTLFVAILEYVLASRSFVIKSQEETLYRETMQGLHREGEPRFRKYMDDKYQKEYESHLRQYKDFMKELKMSRSQRLDKVKNQKVSLVDIAQELSTASAQSNAAEEIHIMSKMRDDELKKMIENGFIYGKFD